MYYINNTLYCVCMRVCMCVHVYACVCAYVYNTSTTAYISPPFSDKSS